MAWFVSLTKTEWPLTKGDYDTLQLSYEVIPASKHRQPDEAQYTKYCRLDIKISRTLSAIWGLGKRALEAQLVEYGKDYIRKELQKDTLAERSMIELSTSNAPNDPLYQIELETYMIPWGFSVE